MYLLFVLINSVFGGGFMVIPFLTAIGAVIFHIEARHAQHSGFTQQINSGTKDVKVVNGKGNVSYWETGYCWFALAAAAITIGILIGQYLSK